MHKKLLILLAVTIVGQHLVACAAEPTLDSLRQTHKAEVDRIRDDHERNMERLLETYGTALDNAIAALRKAGDPDPVLLAVAEKRRFESDKRVPEQSRNSKLPAGIRELQSGYHGATRRAEIESGKKCAALTDRYIAALDRLMRHYTNEDKLDFAMNVKAEMESRAPRPGQNTSIDLGGGVRMAFVWIQALKMWVGKYEVTNGQYRRMAPDHDSRKYERYSLNGDRQPVVYVSFDDARKYAAWLTQKQQSVGALPTGCRFRLPTEREWMTFAQCGDGREFPWGNSWPPRSGRAGNYSDASSARTSKIDGYRDGHPVTCDVENSQANPWGLYGVGGNVWECCARADSIGAFGALRGDSWRDYHRVHLRCSFRFVADEQNRSCNSGFRLVLSR